MHTSRLRAAAFCVLLTSTFLSAPALAQRPEFRHLDENGVDLVEGDFVTSIVEGSIGSGDAKLELRRMLGNTGTNGTVGASQWDMILFNITPSGTYVDFGDRLAKFPGAQARGQTLTGSGGSYVYRAADGTTISFGDPTGMGGVYCDGSQSTCILLPMGITSPDGKTVSFNYEFWTQCTRPTQIDEEPVCSYSPRLAGVSNSYGYSVAFNYAAAAGSGRTGPPAGFLQRTGASFYNNQVGTSPLASVSYATPATGVTDVTDMGGRVWRVTKTGTVNAIRRPGAASDTTSAALSSGKVTSVTREGVTTSYSRVVSGSTATVTATNPLSQSTIVVTNLAVGRPTTVTNALGKTTSYQYDSDLRVKRVTQPEGNYTE
jgi:YD repeat-containing protein